eukprot:13661866-Alexandrium_andersonii.AAC.1
MSAPLLFPRALGVSPPKGRLGKARPRLSESQASPAEAAVAHPCPPSAREGAIDSLYQLGSSPSWSLE